jgi:hypothetical protein
MVEYTIDDMVLSPVVPSFTPVMHKLYFLKREHCHTDVGLLTALRISVFLCYACI